MLAPVLQLALCLSAPTSTLHQHNERFTGKSKEKGNAEDVSGRWNIIIFLLLRKYFYITGSNSKLWHLKN